MCNTTKTRAENIVRHYTKNEAKGYIVNYFIKDFNVNYMSLEQISETQLQSLFTEKCLLGLSIVLIKQ